MDMGIGGARSLPHGRHTLFLSHRLAFAVAQRSAALGNDAVSLAARHGAHGLGLVGVVGGEGLAEVSVP